MRGVRLHGHRASHLAGKLKHLPVTLAVRKEKLPLKKKGIKLVNADKILFNVNQTSLVLLMAAPGLGTARCIGGYPWDDAVDGHRAGQGVVVSSIGGRLGHSLS